MPLFGLDSESVVARARSRGSAPQIPSLGESIAVGGIGFGAVSLAAFGLWARAGRWLSEHTGELGLYASCALILIGGGGAVLSRLVIGPERLRRFFGLFALAFFLYAGVWTGSYFSMRSKSGECLASLLGPGILAMTFANAFGAPSTVRKVMFALIVTHALGYFAGGFLYRAFPGETGKLLWGGAYGLGFGSGIGYALHACQAPTREALKKLLNTSPSSTRPSG